ncbi:MAG: SGNH/GDSL hydrolase family protein [Ktedonobacteraceae bacterium]|nr:SGNH/GDSL hydrolase family protein [Ktedonobacteraceae bacterium]
MKRMTNCPHWQRMPWLPTFTLLFILLLAVPLTGFKTQSAHAATTQWIGSWGASPVAGLPVIGLSTATFRNVVHTSVAGSTVRVQFSNAFGTQPLLIGQATVALPATKGSAAALAGTMKTLTFASSHSITLPAGQQAYSDPLAFSVPANSDLLISVYTPHASGLVTSHVSAIQRSFYSTGANHATDLAATAFTNRTGNWSYVTGIEVQSSQLQGTLVALGDSITNGAHSTGGANHRWPNYLADRLLQLPVNLQYGVLDEGISGNHILTDANNPTTGQYSGVSALHRLNRDVFGHGDVKVLILLEGINDIKNGATSDSIIAGMKQIANQAHQQGIRVLAGTLTPFAGSSGYTPQKETSRQNVNAFLRGNSGGNGLSLFDDVIDFDAAVRDPNHPLQFLPIYDSGDHLHPNDQGYQAMGNTMKLAQL